MNARYNNEVFADSTSGRKALLAKVEAEVAAGRVNIADKDAVEHDILNPCLTASAHGCVVAVLNP